MKLLRISFLAFFVLFVGAQAFADKKTAKLLARNWSIDFNSVIDAMDISEEEKEMTRSMMGSMGEIRMDFTKSGEVSISAMGDVQSGTWALNDKELVLTMAGQDQVFKILAISKTELQLEAAGDDGAAQTLYLKPAGK